MKVVLIEANCCEFGLDLQLQAQEFHSSAQKRASHFQIPRIDGHSNEALSDNDLMQ
jgi:hypothetical protein